MGYNESMASKAETVFDKILSGEIPCYKIYEDDHVLAFLDIGPLCPGHMLVIPKERKAFLHELSDAASAAIGRVLPRLSRALMAATRCTGNLRLQNNGAQAHQVVMHVHFHIIPRFGNDGLDIGWNAKPLPGETADSLLEAMRASLASD